MITVVSFIDQTGRSAVSGWADTSCETSPFKLELGQLIRPRRRPRARPRNRKQFKSIEDEYEDDDETTVELN